MYRLKDDLFTKKFLSLFPETKNADLSEMLDVPLYTIRRMAKKLKVSKSPSFLKLAHQNTVNEKIRKEEERRKIYSPTEIQTNIIIGSLLGDGSLALYGRSTNAHYREHGCKAQDGYRRWKREMLDSLDFRFNQKGLTGKLSSPSHPMYTKWYHQFYDASGRKVITEENIKLLNHPIGLACLFLDDGTLTINTSSKTYRKKMYLHPYLCIYSLSFTKEENIILANHIQKTFSVSFRLKKRPDGYGYILFLSKRNEVYHFMKLIEPYVSQIPCMTYKVDLEKRMEEKRHILSSKFPNKNIIISPTTITSNFYSNAEVEDIISMKRKGVTDATIAKNLNRSYWGITDKIRRLRKEGEL